MAFHIYIYDQVFKKITVLTFTKQVMKGTYINKAEVV